jgi:hypothetical protein
LKLLRKSFLKPKAKKTHGFLGAETVLVADSEAIGNGTSYKGMKNDWMEQYPTVTILINN